MKTRTENLKKSRVSASLASTCEREQRNGAPLALLRGRSGASARAAAEAMSMDSVRDAQRPQKEPRLFIALTATDASKGQNEFARACLSRLLPCMRRSKVCGNLTKLHQTRMTTSAACIQTCAHVSSSEEADVLGMTCRSAPKTWATVSPSGSPSGPYTISSVRTIIDEVAAA